MIDKIHLIKSDELRNHLYSLYDKVVDMCILCEDSFKEGLTDSKIELRDDIRKLLYHCIMGVDSPIFLSDSNVCMVHNYVMVSMCIDYKVFSQFKPYQDETMFLSFYLDNNIVRDHKINKIIL